MMMMMMAVVVDLVGLDDADGGFHSISLVCLSE
jgi:hypothetical protein